MTIEYFKWLCHIIKGKKYTDLLWYLHNIDFKWLIAMDENRAEDGLSLRYRFQIEKKYEDVSKLELLGQCSVFEMMVALSIRCEEQFMDNLDYGNRTSEWFDRMLFNLKLHDLDDGHFNNKIAEDIIYNFLNRKYDTNGSGGLFMIQNPPDNFVNTEIWYQMCMYLNEII